MGRGGGYGIIRSKRVKAVLRALEISTGKFTYTGEGRHGKVEKDDGTESYPIPLSHKYTNLFIIEKLAKKLEVWGVCSKEEFLQKVK